MPLNDRTVRLLFPMIAFLVGVGVRAESVAPLAPTPPSALVYLRQFLGQSPSANHFWRTEPLGLRLRKLLGKRSAVFNQNMRLAEPLAVSGNILFQLGSAQVKSEQNRAALQIDLERDALDVWISLNGQEYRYSERSPIEPLDAVRRWLAGVPREAQNR